MAIARAHLFISGLVQGVFYRATCRDEAAARGLGGWVRNLADGRVEAVIEGEKETVQSLIAWCREGPSGSRVTGVETTWEEPKGEKGGFRVTY